MSGKIINLIPGIDRIEGPTRLVTWLEKGMLKVHIRHRGYEFDFGGYNRANKDLSSITKVGDTLYYLFSHSENVEKAFSDNGFNLTYTLEQ